MLSIDFVNFYWLFKLWSATTSGCYFSSALAWLSETASSAESWPTKWSSQGSRERSRWSRFYRPRSTNITRHWRSFATRERNPWSTQECRCRRFRSNWKPFSRCQVTRVSWRKFGVTSKTGRMRTCQSSIWHQSKTHTRRISLRDQREGKVEALCPQSHRRSSMMQMPSPKRNKVKTRTPMSLSITGKTLIDQLFNTRWMMTILPTLSRMAIALAHRLLVVFTQARWSQRLLLKRKTLTAKELDSPTWTCLRSPSRRREKVLNIRMPQWTTNSVGEPQTHRCPGIQLTLNWLTWMDKIRLPLQLKRISIKLIIEDRLKG